MRATIPGLLPECGLGCAITACCTFILQHPLYLYRKWNWVQHCESPRSRISRQLSGTDGASDLNRQLPACASSCRSVSDKTICRASAKGMTPNLISCIRASSFARFGDHSYRDRFAAVCERLKIRRLAAVGVQVPLPGTNLSIPIRRVTGPSVEGKAASGERASRLTYYANTGYANTGSLCTP